MEVVIRLKDGMKKSGNKHHHGRDVGKDSNPLPNAEGLDVNYLENLIYNLEKLQIPDDLEADFEVMEAVSVLMSNLLKVLRDINDSPSDFIGACSGRAAARAGAAVAACCGELILDLVFGTEEVF